MFPDVPYPGYSWRLNHHMGRVTPDHLYHILWAANRFSRNADPAADINNYLIANSQWTANIREDSGQPEGWRDYQQTLSELGLIYSLEVIPQITPTPLGLALLDGSLGFSEVMTLQALRLQYPVSSSPWLDAQHQYVGIAQRAVERNAQRAVAAATATGRHTRPIRRPIPLPTAHRLASAAEAAAEEAAAAQGRAGRQPVRQCRTRLLRCAHSRRSAKPSRS